MKVVLVAIHSAPSPQAVPLANAYLKAYLSTDEGLASSVSVELCDLFVSQEPADAAALIAAHAPDAVGFSLYLWNRAAALRIASVLRRERPGLTLFAGGPEATADPEGILACSAFDFLILGEGEIPFVEALERLRAGKSPRGAAGLAFLDGGRLAAGPQRPVRLLDSIPSPLLTGVIDPARYSGLLWQLSRGCDFACDYCFDSRGERGVRRFSLGRVDAELDLIVKSRVSQVFVLDSTFNVDIKRAKAVLRMIRRRAPHVHFHFEVRSEFIDREMAGLFASITCSLQIGLQSADPTVLKGIRRSFDPRDFAGRIMLLNESGAVFGFDLIYGLPGDSLRGFARSLDYALGLYPNHLDIFPLAVLPGTPLAQRALDTGLDHLPEPPYTLLGSPTFTPADMAAATRLAAASDVFYSRGKAVAWFNPVASALGMAPAALLAAFGEWLAGAAEREVDQTSLSDRDIWRMQRDFLGRVFVERGAEELLPAAIDLVDYHYHFAAALLSPLPALPTDRDLAATDLLALPVTLAASTRLARFSYEIVDLLEAGEVDLREFAACFSPSGSWAAIYPRGGDVFTESLIEPHFRLLEALDGMTVAGDAAKRLGIPREEASSFLEFSAAEGIVLVPSRR